MNRYAPLTLAFAITFGGLSASAAEPVYLGIGETKVINISRSLKGAVAQNGTLISVKKKGHGAVSIEGKALGTTPVTLRTHDGAEFEVMVQVIPAGASVYSLNRDEPSRKGRAAAVRRSGNAASEEWASTGE